MTYIRSFDKVVAISSVESQESLESPLLLDWVSQAG